MSKYVVIFSIGPVQTFIASARRSRDLWSGSWLLSELAKACAKSLKDSQAELIFPYVENDDDLKENSEFSVGNKIQAVITADNEERLKLVINEAKDAVNERFKNEADNAWRDLPTADKDLRKDIWDKQIGDYLEIQTAWVKITDDYISATQKAGQILASRKATRDFNPSAITPYDSQLMIPKSSLDGIRETVLKEDDSLKNLTRLKLSLSKSEQLDTVGVIKRLGFKEKAEQFTPISRVMADSWIERLIAHNEDLSKVKENYEELENLGVATRVRGNDKIYQNFAYDGQLLYSSRIDALIREWQGSDDAIVDWANELKSALKPLWRKYGEPYRYGVLLRADGDRMGELLDKAKSQKEHQAITQALSAFAGGVSQIMRNHRGHCIYAGGDDVLGFVPLDKAYECANDLQQSFLQSLAEIAGQLNVDKSPTLSVGLAICHIMTPLSVIRELASQAEKHAKGDHIENETSKINERRDALGILLSIRSGNDTKLRYNWSDEKGLKVFKEFIKFYRKKEIPSRIAYDIRAIYLCTKDFAEGNKDLLQNIQKAELTRMLKQARTDNGQEIKKAIIDELAERGEVIGLDKLADELIVARWFSAKTQKDLGKE
ncbi:hypothetical protein AAX09_02140 [Moraxella bovoculi]|uniref:CRISPR-associated RAMP Cmr2 n=1 Tax=Moraxella bovoculi 237 TaxID=743974 RepID=A0A066UK74_9GAMM|nr:type III-B CRISPR-associated protein Cas10/Cmr2 [Moraxella bovoculi]AKG18399.1 hypothetical protein AAX09_02140 [Moraxella bovoculi]KDN24608.1 CRISPR-associated RAMP Cmr2 [Moraxella bovoculi 237]NSM10895.1 type III-B CRISPR-associated protein Cas10/Cmr2 [Moraxella bovoculi]